MDLFENSLKKIIEKEQPLAAKMRPKRLDDFIGQESIIGKGRLLYRAIKADQISSIIFYGPPGTGKTTLAAVIANTTKSNFITINAVLAGVKNIREAIEDSKEKRKLYNQHTILFVDEVHRWNKAQQDALLPWVENGTIILIGATTENPFFEVNRALVSRSRVFQLKSLTEDDLKKIVNQALNDNVCGYGNINIKIDGNALDHLVKVSGGDARSLLNALELAVETTPEVFPPPANGKIHITLKIAEDSIQQRAVLYDKEGDYHFDTISAFIKSLRGSDPDAAMYWLAKMVYAGENPRFLLRRMLIFASEDIGLADPNALVITEAAASAFDRVGMPEGRYHLANTALYLATAPKSNSVMAFFDALNAVENEENSEIPNHLKDASRDRKAFGHGEGYLYPHSYREHWIAQQYLPATLQGKMFYSPGGIGYEAKIKELVEKRREIQLSAFIETQSEPTEVLTFSPPEKDIDQWYVRAAGNINKYLVSLRNSFFENINIPRHYLCLDLSGDTYIFVWELLRKVLEGAVWTITEKQYEAMIELSSRFPELNRPVILKSEINMIKEKINNRENMQFDLIIGKNIIFKNPDKEIFNDLNSLLNKNGILYLMESVPHLGQRLTKLSIWETLNKNIFSKLEEAEENIFNTFKDKSAIKDKDTINDFFKKSGFNKTELKTNTFKLLRKITLSDIDNWFSKTSDKSYYRFIKDILSDNQIEEAKAALRNHILNKNINWEITTAFIKVFK